MSARVRVIIFVLYTLYLGAAIAVHFCCFSFLLC